MREVLTVRDVAKLLDCADKTVEEQARRGLLPGLKFGTSWVFPAEALAQSLNERATLEARKRAARVPPTAVLVSNPPTPRRRPRPPLPALPRNE